MDRRHFLARVGAGTAVLAGGCLEDANAASDTTETPRPTIDEQLCPPYTIDRDHAVCSKTVDSDTTPVYLDVAPRSSTLDDGTPAEETTLTLYNQSDTDLRFNPHSWRIRHLSDDDWTALNQQLVGDGVATVSAGTTHTWSFVEVVASIRDDSELNPGLYAAEIGVPDPVTNDEWIACIALVRFEASE